MNENEILIIKLIYLNLLIVKLKLDFRVTREIVLKVISLRRLKLFHY